MRIRPYLYASLALVAALPATALAGETVTASITPAVDVPAGATVQVNCRAEGSPSMGQATLVVKIDVTASGGTVNPATLLGAVSTPCPTNPSATCSVIQGSSAWTTPAVPGTYTATCTGWFQGTFGGPYKKLATATLTTVAAPTLPPVVSAIGGPAEVAVGSTSAFDVVASDPNTPARPLTYAWTAARGTIDPATAASATARWVAPDETGAFELAVTVSNGETSMQAKKTVNVVLARFQAGLPLSLAAPRRLAAGDAGKLFVVDGQQGTTGQIALVTARGEARGFAAVPEPALAVASGAGVVWVTTSTGALYRVDPVTGRNLGKVALSGGPLRKPLGIAYDAPSMRLWIAETDANRVRVITPDGATVRVVTHANGAPLRGPVDVAVDGGAGRAWVLLGNAKKDPYPGEPVEVARYLHAFDLEGRHVGSYMGQGGGLGKLTRGGGVTVDARSRVYASDAYQGTVQVLDRNGAPLGSIGAVGAETGQLLNPMGLAVMANGDVAVANATRGTVDRFGAGAALPVCADDSDCDGLPDAWELANGLDPYWAGDALVDLDGDGLSNAEEYAAGTNPRMRDSDGDGFSDPDELLAGFDPTAPNDHRPVVSASGPREVGPGLVRLSAVASGNGTCGFRWTQAGGPAVALRDADTGSPSFIARAAGAHDFDVVATCGAAGAHDFGFVATYGAPESAPGRVRVVVRNVAPAADAGSVIVATPGSPIRLDALASSDANGDALAFTWDQTLGAPIAGTEAGGTLAARARGEGLYAFQVTVADPSGASATAEVPVLVTAGPAPTAIAGASPAEVEQGSTVVLDATSSRAQPGAAFAWEQLSGPPHAQGVTIHAADEPVAWFVPPAAGRYEFQVSVRQGTLRSPPARVEVFAAETGRALPAVTATAPSIVAVNAPVTLDAVASGGSVAYAWRQVSGPAAGVSDADRASATAVPFVPGFYVFEVSAKDGDAQSRPARVAFEARAGGKAIPQARIAARTGDAWVGELVFLDGRASTGATRFRWTQVAGPWVPLGAQSSVTSFRPLSPGAYAFELQVDDGTVRSAPARVEVTVVSGEGGR